MNPDEPAPSVASTVKDGSMNMFSTSIANERAEQNKSITAMKASRSAWFLFGL
jgi:hypothetical protein